MISRIPALSFQSWILELDTCWRGRKLMTIILISVNINTARMVHRQPKTSRIQYINMLSNILNCHRSFFSPLFVQLKWCSESCKKVGWCSSDLLFMIRLCAPVQFRPSAARDGRKSFFGPGFVASFGPKLRFVATSSYFWPVVKINVFSLWAAFAIKIIVIMGLVFCLDS